MNLSQLRALVAVVEMGNVTDAALTLGLTQSAVSHAMASLEKELGVRLVVRHRAGCTLTELGRKVMPSAIEALRQIDRFGEIAAAEVGLHEGRLRIGAFPSACQLLPPLIADFTRRYPSVTVILLEGNDQEVNDWIDQRIVEIGVVVGPRPDLGTLDLADDEMLAILPLGHSLTGRIDVDATDLSGDSFVMSTGGCEPIIRTYFESQEIPLHPTHRIAEMATLVSMVREGLGVSIVPALSIDFHREGIIALPLRPRVARNLYLAHKSNDELSPAANAFLQVLRRRPLEHLDSRVRQ